VLLFSHSVFRSGSSSDSALRFGGGYTITGWSVWLFERNYVEVATGESSFAGIDFSKSISQSTGFCWQHICAE
jgi:hypothetical protein